MKLPEVVIHERDATMFEMKKQGLTYRQIGKALGVSESTAYKGVKRMTDKITRQLAIDYGQEILMDVQRLDGMLVGFLPQTRSRKIQTPDGEEVEIPPSPDAANIVLKIMDRRSKLLGLDQQSEAIMIGVTSSSNQPALGVAQEDEKETTPEDEAKKLLKIFREARVLDEDVFSALLGTANKDEVVDAEIVDDETSLPLAIEMADLEPPEFVDTYDEENPEFVWKPEAD